jgi:hypothetical protein
VSCDDLYKISLSSDEKFLFRHNCKQHNFLPYSTILCPGDELISASLLFGLETCGFFLCWYLSCGDLYKFHRPPIITFCLTQIKEAHFFALSHKASGQKLQQAMAKGGEENSQ